MCKNLQQGQKQGQSKSKHLTITACKSHIGPILVSLWGCMFWPAVVSVKVGHGYVYIGRWANQRRCAR